MLIDQGAIDTTSVPWALHPAKVQAAQIPQTLTGVLQARLDGLPKPERLALQQASVIGPVFWIGIGRAQPSGTGLLARAGAARTHAA